MLLGFLELDRSNLLDISRVDAHVVPDYKLELGPNTECVSSNLRNQVIPPAGEG